MDDDSKIDALRSKIDDITSAVEGALALSSTLQYDDELGECAALLKQALGLVRSGRGRISQRARGPRPPAARPETAAPVTETILSPPEPEETH